MSVSGGIMPFSSVETKKIVEIDFGLFNPDDIVSTISSNLRHRASFRWRRYQR